MPVTQSLKDTTQDHPQGVATLYGDRRRTWAEVADRVARLAGGLRALGVGPDDRVAVWTLNSDRYVELLYAVAWAGAVIVPLNTRLVPAEIRLILEDAETGTLVVDEMSHPQLRDALGGAVNPRIIYAGEGPPPDDTVGYEELIDHPPIEDAGRGGSDLYGIFYTAGTTGRSKGVMLSHSNIVANLENVSWVLDRAMDPGEGPGTYLHTAPMFHLADLGSTFSITARGGTHAVVARFDPVDTSRAIEKFRATSVMMVPTMVNMVLHAPEFASFDLSSLRYLTYGASPMPPAVMARAIELLPNVRFLQGYGMSELSPVATFLEPQYHVFDGPLAGKLKSAGRAAGSAEVRVVEIEDRPVPNGTVGEIVVRGPMVMQGYWKQPELTARAIRDGWMHTGDAGYIDDDGFVFIVDRLKDMIISGGENIYCVEVESAIYTHPAVGMCAVFGIPSEEWGEAVHAVVVLKAGATATEPELIELCRARLAHYKCPRTIAFRAEPMPLSGAGKILKTELRAPVWQGRTRGVN